MVTATALSDAAILYGARRYYDGVHNNSTWKYRGKFREEDDKLLFLEFLHNLCLYDRIIMDKRPIEGSEQVSYGELSEFLTIVNNAARIEAISFGSYGRDHMNVALVCRIQEKICGIVASYINNNAALKIEAVKVPWSYHEPLHQDREAIRRGLMKVGLNDNWLPFTLFVWRAVWYGAIANREA